MPPFLAADSLPPADPVFGMQAIVWIIIAGQVVSTLVGIAAFFRRKPSVDVDLTKLATEVHSLKAEVVEVRRKLGAIFGRLDDGTNTMGQLQAAQGVNTANIASTLKMVEHIDEEVTQRLNEHAALFKAQASRIDDLYSNRRPK